MKNPMTRITIARILSWGPCLTRKQIADLWPKGRRSVAPLEIADAAHVQAGYRLWALLRPEIIPEVKLRLLACDFAERVLLQEREVGREPDPRSWRAIEVARAYARGEATEEELNAARTAAWDAARAAWAAWDAAWDAARAAWDAWDAARGAWAARAAEEAWQLARVREVLVELEATNE